MALGNRELLASVDPTLAEILDEAASYFPYEVRATSGKAPRPSEQSFHPRGKAIDIEILKDGKALPNYQSAEAFNEYQQFAHLARQIQQQKYPDLSNQFRWGGYFGNYGGRPDTRTGKPYGQLDLMHFDLGGSAMAGGSWDTGINSQLGSLYGIQPTGAPDVSSFLQQQRQPQQPDMGGYFTQMQPQQAEPQSQPQGNGLMTGSASNNRLLGGDQTTNPFSKLGEGISNMFGSPMPPPQRNRIQASPPGIPQGDLASPVGVASGQNVRQAEMYLPPTATEIATLRDASKRASKSGERVGYTFQSPTEVAAYVLEAGVGALGEILAQRKEKEFKHARTEALIEEFGQYRQMMDTDPATFIELMIDRRRQEHEIRKEEMKLEAERAALLEQRQYDERQLEQQRAYDQGLWSERNKTTFGQQKEIAEISRAPRPFQPEFEKEMDKAFSGKVVGAFNALDEAETQLNKVHLMKGILDKVDTNAFADYEIMISSYADAITYLTGIDIAPETREELSKRSDGLQTLNALFGDALFPILAALKPVSEGELPLAQGLIPQIGKGTGANKQLIDILERNLRRQKREAETIIKISEDPSKTIYDIQRELSKIRAEEKREIDAWIEENYPEYAKVNDQPRPGEPTSSLLRNYTPEEIEEKKEYARQLTPEQRQQYLDYARNRKAFQQQQQEPQQQDLFTRGDLTGIGSPPSIQPTVPSNPPVGPAMPALAPITGGFEGGQLQLSPEELEELMRRSRGY